MPQTTITVSDKTNLLKLTKELKQAMKKGVLKASDSGVEWIKGEIFNDQKFVGSSLYPNVTKATRAIKAKKGMNKVGIMTGNLRDSFDTHYTDGGLTGHIRGGGKKYGRFLAIWQIDKLFYKYRAKKSREIVDKEIKRVL